MNESEHNSKGSNDMDLLMVEKEDLLQIDQD